MAAIVLFGSFRMWGQGSTCPDLSYSRMRVVGNAPVVDLTIHGDSGLKRTVHLVLDTGGGALILNQPVASLLGLQPGNSQVTEDGQVYARTNAVDAQIGGLSVKLTSEVYIHLGDATFDTRERVDGLLPGRALQGYVVVLDYPRRRFMIAPPGCLKHQGVPVPSPALKNSGHPRVEVSLLGTKCGLLLDTGSRVSLAKKSLLLQLTQTHPKWPSATAASGDADMPGSHGKELLLRVPSLHWGQFTLRHVLFASRPDATYGATFETPQPIVGVLGGDALKHFRLEIDYPKGITWLIQTSRGAKKLNSVGLDLDVDGEGNLIVVAVTSSASKQTRSSIRPGDRIIQIGHKRRHPWTITEASDALAGKPGSVKHLLLRREDRLCHVEVTVAALL